jgi:hypothetical protein
MTTKQLLSLTLLATSLTLNAAVTRTTQHTSIQKSNSISHILFTLLKDKGIEDKSAKKISSTFIGENEELLSLMIKNYLTKTKIKPDRLYTELSRLALKKEKLNLNSYASLVKLTQKFSKMPLSKQELTNLHTISQNNQLLDKVFA